MAYKETEFFLSQPIENIDYPLDECFLIGLVEGDGCYSIYFKGEKHVRACFHIASEARSSHPFFFFFQAT